MRHAGGTRAGALLSTCLIREPRVNCQLLQPRPAPTIGSHGTVCHTERVQHNGFAGTKETPFCFGVAFATYRTMVADSALLEMSFMHSTATSRSRSSWYLTREKQPRGPRSFPHFQPRGSRNTRVYVARERLIGTDLPGYGVFHYHDGLRLTAPGSKRLTEWRLPDCFHPDTGVSLTYHPSPASWQVVGGPDVSSGGRTWAGVHRLAQRPGYGLGLLHHHCFGGAPR